MANVLTRVALVCALVLSAGAATTGVTGAATTSQPIAVYAAPDGTASVLYGNGSTSSTGVGAAVVGPMANFDDDGALEAPVVDGSGTLRLVDTAGETRTLVTGSVASSKTYLPSGDWDGDGDRAVFYENTNDGKLYRVEPGGSPAAVVGPDGNALATNAPVGVADYDGDGDRDVVFLGSSSTVKYYDGESVESTGFSSFGANNGLGLGAPADFDGDGTPRVPYVTGSNNLALLAADGTQTTVTPNYGGAAKAPVGAADWTGDDAPELLHVNRDDDEIYYATLSGDTGPVETPSGATVSAAVAPGVAPAAAPPAPAISDFSATNPADRDVAVSFTSSDPLTDIAVDVSGSENATLTEADFEESGGGPYQYVATYAASTDGTYTATLVRAVNARGVDGSAGQENTVTVETQAPAVTSVAISDADGNGVVGAGDRVRVTATAESEGEVTSVTANASAFGAGTVSLEESARGYSGQFTVGAVDGGPASVCVSATNEYGYTDTAASGTLVVDTTPPTANAGRGQTVPAGTTANFDAADSTDDTGIVRYEWTFGDGTSATGVTASHTYAETGTYTVTLTVTDAAGHTATDSITVTVVEEGTTVTVRPPSTNAPPPSTAPPAGADGGTATAVEQARIDPATGQVSVTPGPGRSVRITFADLSANQPVSADYRDVAPPAESTPIQGVRFVPEHSGTVSMAVEGLAGPPSDVPNLSARSGVRVLDYVRIDHSVPNEQVHGVTFTLVVPKEQLGADDHGTTVALYRYHDGMWTPHDARKVEETRRAVTYRVGVPGLSVYALGERRAAIRVIEADAARTSLTVGESVRVTATLENRGTSRRTRRIAFRVDGSVADTTTVSLAPDERRTVAFDYKPTRAGEHEVSVGGVPAETLSVAAASPAVPGALPRWLLVAGLLLLAFVCGYAARRWRGSGPEPESGDGPPLPELPDDQRQALIAAYESGYFDIPRTATLDDLAERLDLSEQEVSRQLRRGLAALLSVSLTGEAPDSEDAGSPSGHGTSERPGEGERLGEGEQPGDSTQLGDGTQLGEGGMEWGPSDTERRRD